MKANKLVMTRTQLEISLVRPGQLGDDTEDGKIDFNDMRIKLMKVILIQKLKGLSERMLVSKNMPDFRGQNLAAEDSLVGRKVS